MSRKETSWKKAGFHMPQAGDPYLNSEVIADYGSTGVSLPFFIGTVFGIIGILVIVVLVVPFTGLRMVSGIVLCFLILPTAIVTLARDLRKATLELTNEALVIRRFLHRPVVIQKEEIATVEVRDNIPPIPVWLQTVLTLALIPTSSAGIVYMEYLQFASGEITTSSFLQYLGVYPSIVLFFLVIYYHSRVRSRYKKLLTITTTSRKLAGIYTRDPGEIERRLGRSV